ncbi:hypothetical protein TNCV_867431 [Trichonephila clavipes]|nr:hypothetical protein TNCV_867431 [Trichonephila clavipes]
MKKTILQHPSYSPDFGPRNFRIFLELARHLKGRRFQSAVEVKSASQAELKDMGKNGSQKCFDELYKRCQKCTVAQGSYFEGRCVAGTYLVILSKL